MVTSEPVPLPGSRLQSFQGLRFQIRPLRRGCGELFELVPDLAALWLRTRLITSYAGSFRRISEFLVGTVSALSAEVSVSLG